MEYRGVLISVDGYMNVQMANAEEYIDGTNTGALGEILIRSRSPKRHAGPKRRKRLLTPKRARREESPGKAKENEAPQKVCKKTLLR
ncbi:unnamed protein product, partial [Mesorhabditis belari]|uniref:Sm domain-containing protein n=1 Tax=Mesorhabditis belari TaxID=2138241 RepID=A0AAF3F6Y9_9BILA